MASLEGSHPLIVEMLFVYSPIGIYLKRAKRAPKTFLVAPSDQFWGLLLGHMRPGATEVLASLPSYSQLLSHHTLLLYHNRGKLTDGNRKIEDD